MSKKSSKLENKAEFYRLNEFKQRQEEKTYLL